MQGYQYGQLQMGRSSIIFVEDGTQAALVQRLSGWAIQRDPGFLATDRSL
jgi:hypothetical protein